MSNLENILSEFASFIDKSAAAMNTSVGGTTPQQAQAPAAGSTEQSGQTPAAGPVAGQPTVRANETNPISTLKSPLVSAGPGKAPTSNAAPKKIDFKPFA